MIEFRMPRLSLSDDEEMVVSRWYFDEGAEFKEGDPLLEVETAKALMQVEAPSDGVLMRIMVGIETEIRQGDLLALLGAVGESAPELPVVSQEAALPAIPELVSTPMAASGQRSAAPQREAARATLEVERIAFSQSGELYGIPANRVSRSRERGPQGRSVDASIPSSKHRATLARLMTKSATIPQFSVRKEVRMEGAVALVQQLRDTGFDTTLTDVLLRVVAIALTEHPQLNAHYGAEAVSVFPEPAIALATDSPNGVIAPVIRNPHLLPWPELAEERRRIVEGARAGRLSLSDINGGTFSLSNVGALGGDGVVPLLTPPQVGILGVGAVRRSWEGLVADMDLVADHRALDGADAARFLKTVTMLLGPESSALSPELHLR